MEKNVITAKTAPPKPAKLAQKQDKTGRQTKEDKAANAEQTK